MGCPQPLDPLCVAIMLRLSQGHAGSAVMASDLGVTPGVIRERLERLESIGAVTGDPEPDCYELLPGAHRIIVRITESDLGFPSRNGAERFEPRCAERLEPFQQHPMFRKLPYEELVWLARVSRTQRYRVGEVIALEGDECPGMYVVESGTVRLVKGSSSSAFGFGREQTIQLLGRGDSFNEVPVFDGGTNLVTAEAVNDVSVILVTKKDVQSLASRCPDFADLVINVMSQQLRHMLAMVEDISMRDVTGRVAKILRQAETPLDGVGSGIVTGQRLTQREIAWMAGTAREVVARALKKMERAGAVRINRGKVEIVDAALLESFI